MTEQVASFSLKGRIQRFLDRVGVYQRVKASWIYDFYWSLADKRILDDRRSEAEFYRNVLRGFRKGDLVFDVGANQGYKTGIFLELGGRVVAIEPDEACQNTLKQKFFKYRLRRKPLAIVSKAMSDESSIKTMWVNAPGSAKNSLSRKWADTLRRDDRRFGHTLDFAQLKQVETVSLENLIREHGLPFYVKIDVEGHELSVLRGLKRPVPFLSFEVNLPEFRDEGLECLRLLASLEPHGEFNYTPDCRCGLALKQWSDAGQFSAVLESCSYPSIEIFWKTCPPGETG